MIHGGRGKAEPWDPPDWFIWPIGIAAWCAAIFIAIQLF